MLLKLWFDQMQRFCEAYQSTRVFASRSLALILPVSLFLGVLGAKFFQIRLFGAPIPHWDQWLGEGWSTIKPWLEGRFGFDELIAPHNEHRIALTRLLVILLLEANRQWDPVLQMAVNAVIHALTVVFLWCILFRTASRPLNLISLFLITAIYALPYAWENTLLPFQSQLYLLVLSSILALHFLSSAPAPLSGRWLWGAAFLFLATFSQSSGALGAASGLAILVLRCWKLRAFMMRDVLAMLVLFALIATRALGWVDVPSLEGYESRSVGESFQYSLRLLAWPSQRWYAFFAVIFHAPYVFLAATILRRSTLPSARRLFLLALGLWVYLHIIAIAHLRGGGFPPIASRYTDFLMLGGIVNALAVFLLTVRTRRAAICAAWWVIYGALLVNNSLVQSWSELPSKLAQSRKQIENVRAYVTTHDISYLRGKPELDIPFPFPEDLARFLDDTSLRSVLPYSIREPLLISVAGQAGKAFKPQGVSPFAPVPPGEKVIGSFSSSNDPDELTGHLETNPIGPVQLPYLEFLVAGDVGRPGIGISIIPTDGSAPVGVAPRGRLGERWDGVLVRAPGVSFGIAARDESLTEWGAFAGIRERGALGSWVQRILSHAEWLLVLGLSLPMGMLFYRLFATA